MVKDGVAIYFNRTPACFFPSLLLKVSINSFNSHFMHCKFVRAFAANSVSAFVFSTLKDTMNVMRVNFDDTGFDFVVVKLSCFLPACCFLSIPCPFLFAHGMGCCRQEDCDVWVQGGVGRSIVCVVLSLSDSSELVGSLWVVFQCYLQG